MNISRYKSKIISSLRKFNQRQSTTNYILSVVIKILSLVFGFITTIFQAKYYGIEIIGLIAIYNSILSLAAKISVVGIDTTLIRLISEKSISHPLNEITWAIFKKAISIAALFSTIVAAIIFISSCGFELLSNHPSSHIKMLRWLLPFIIIQSLYQIGLSLLRSTNLVRSYILFENVGSLLNLFLLLPVTFFHYDRYNPLFTNYFTSLLLGIVLFFYLSNKFIDVNAINRKKNQIEYAEILSVSIPIFLIECINYLITNVDFWLLGIFNNLEYVGIYQVIVRLSELSSLAMNTLNTLLAPQISKLYFESRMSELELVAKQVSLVGTIISLPIFLILIASGNSLLNLWGSQLTIGYTSMTILLLGQTINSVCGSVANFLKLTGNQIDLMTIFIAAVTLKTLLNIFLIPTLGMNGAAISSCITLIYWNLKSAYLILNKYNIWLPIVPLYRN